MVRFVKTPDNIVLIHSTENAVLSKIKTASACISEAVKTRSLDLSRIHKEWHIEISALEKIDAVSGPMEEMRRAKCYSAYRMVEFDPMSIVDVIESFGTSPRRCMDPVDYVYGVLGVIPFDIPRMTDPKKVWQQFLSHLEKLIPPLKKRMASMRPQVKIQGINDRAYQVDLSTASNMADVYNNLIIVEVDASKW